MTYTGNLGLNQPAAQQIFQRDTRTGGAFGLGTGQVTLAIAPTAPISLLEFRLRDANAPASVLLPWSSGAANLQVGSQSLSIAVPATTGWYYVDLRPDEDPSATASTINPIGVGEVIVAAGQSLATDFWSTAANGDTTTLASLGVSVSPFCSALAAWDGNALPTPQSAWAAPSDTGAYRSAFAAEFLRLVVNATGVNAALIGYGHSGTDIGTYWQPGLLDYENLTSVIAAAGGKFGALIWCQGHNDADARSGSQYHLTPEAIYFTKLTHLISGLAAAFPLRSFTRLLCSIPSIQAPAAAKYSVAGISAIRNAHNTYVASDPLATYVAGLDITLANDGIHPSQAGNITFARHFYRAFIKSIGLGTTGDSGPSLTGSAYRSRGGSQIFIPVSQAEGSAFVVEGDPRTQFKVYLADDTVDELEISALDLSNPRQIRIELASTPLDDQALDVWYRRPFDTATAITSGIYNSEIDGDGLTIGRQVSLIPSPLRVAAPSQCWHRSLLIRPGVPLLLKPNRIALID